jgi:hypothetical protein
MDASVSVGRQPTRGDQDMKRIGIVGLVLVAVFALSAVAAAVAFGAESEFLNAKKESPKGITFKGTGGNTFFESENKDKVDCEKSESEGEFLGVLEAKAVVKYSGSCKLSGVIDAKCPEIETKELKVQPGTKVGNEEVRLLEFLPKLGEVMAEFTCESVKVVVLGGVFCKNTEPKLGLKTEVECKQTKAGEQEFKRGIVNGNEIEDVLLAEATDFFTIKERDAQNQIEDVTFSAEVEQTG